MHGMAALLFFMSPLDSSAVSKMGVLGAALLVQCTSQMQPLTCYRCRVDHVNLTA
jgi:hypothetical protein